MHAFRRGAFAVAVAAATMLAVGVPGVAAQAPVKATKIKVTKVYDGDTLRLSNGVTVRILGIDSPEKGSCGYTQATKKLKSLVQGKKVTVVNPKSVNDKDKYGRALRSIKIGGKDVGASMIKSGWANARYDSLNGYQKHPRQKEYRALDKKTKHKCGAKEDKKGEVGAKPKGKSATGKEPWNQPGPDLDCSDIRKKVRITGTDYHRLDRDGDGWACESYG